VVVTGQCSDAVLGRREGMMAHSGDQTEKRADTPPCEACEKMADALKQADIDNAALRAEVERRIEMSQEQTGQIARILNERDSARAKVEKSMGALREVVRWRLAETNDPFPWELLSSICALLGKKIHSLTEAREVLEEGK
jgi:hypothetical protein